MWSFARVELNIDNGEFFALTLRQWNELVERHSHQVKRRDEMIEVMIAQLIAKVHNVSLGGCKHPIKPEDVMPSQWAKTSEKKAETPIRKRREESRLLFRALLDSRIANSQKG